MEKYGIIMHFRCTREEKEKITSRAARENKSVSAYVRDAALNRNEPEADPALISILEKLREASTFFTALP